MFREEKSKMYKTMIINEREEKSLYSEFSGWWNGLSHGWKQTIIAGAPLLGAVAVAIGLGAVGAGLGAAFGLLTGEGVAAGASGACLLGLTAGAGSGGLAGILSGLLFRKE
ncbi:MAG: hypothetical protein K5873_07035 [Treponema sp.]|nr:hypothetical protein [Treponema sp.]